jgi:hypothetical protein
MQTYLLGQVMQDEREREIRRLLARQAHLRALGRRTLGETVVRSMRRLFAPTAFGPAAEDENRPASSVRPVRPRTLRS